MSVYQCACGGEECNVSFHFKEFFASRAGHPDTVMMALHGKEDEIFLSKDQVIQLRDEINHILERMENHAES